MTLDELCKLVDELETRLAEVEQTVADFEFEYEIEFTPDSLDS